MVQYDDERDFCTTATYWRLDSLTRLIKDPSHPYKGKSIIRSADSRDFMNHSREACSSMNAAPPKSCEHSVRAEIWTVQASRALCIQGLTPFCFHDNALNNALNVH